MGGNPEATWVEETAFLEADRKTVEELDRGSENGVGGMAGMPNRQALRHVRREQKRKTARAREGWMPERCPEGGAKVRCDG